MHRTLRSAAPSRRPARRALLLVVIAALVSGCGQDPMSPLNRVGDCAWAISNAQSVVATGGGGAQNALATLYATGALATNCTPR